MKKLMMNNPPQPAVIYCRVSSKKQKTEGHGLDSQESRCRDYAATRGYDVEAVFPDDVSGGGDFMNRPGMVNLLRYLDAQTDKSYIVIFDDLKRFARDTEFHIKLRREFDQRGAKVECLNFTFDDTPEGQFIETILAAQGALEREQNKRQVSQKMLARVNAGYWCFCPPRGYTFQKVAGHGKMLVRREPAASLVAEAIEGYATGRFASRAEVTRFLESKPGVFGTHKTRLSPQHVVDLLKNPLYAGFITIKKWGIHMLKAQHDPLVSFATYQKVQDRLNGTAYAPARADLNDDFPLRGFITCGSCNSPLTACWSKGRSKRYPYYLCHTKGCPDYRKSIRRDQIEGDFATFLHTLRPSANLFTLAFEMFRDLWTQQEGQVEEDRAAITKQIADLDRNSKQLLDRLMAANTNTLIAVYESRLHEIEDQNLFLREKLAALDAHRPSFKAAFRTAFEFLANPWKLWASNRLEDKRAVLKLVFTAPLAYDRKTGLRTAKITSPFKALKDLSNQNSIMVEPRGVEPSRRFPAYSLSRGAPSTTRPPLRCFV